MPSALTFDLLFTATARFDVALPEGVTWADVTDYGAPFRELQLKLRDGRTLRYPVEVELLKHPDVITVMDTATEDVLAEQ